MQRCKSWLMSSTSCSKEERLKFQQPLLDALSPEGMEYFKSTVCVSLRYSGYH